MVEKPMLMSVLRYSVSGSKGYVHRASEESVALLKGNAKDFVKKATARFGAIEIVRFAVYNKADYDAASRNGTTCPAPIFDAKTIEG